MLRVPNRSPTNTGPEIDRTRQILSFPTARPADGVAGCRPMAPCFCACPERNGPGFSDIQEHAPPTPPEPRESGQLDRAQNAGFLNSRYDRAEGNPTATRGQGAT